MRARAPRVGVADGICACNDLISSAPIDEGAPLVIKEETVALGDANEKAPPNGAGAKRDDVEG